MSWKSMLVAPVVLLLLARSALATTVPPAGSLVVGADSKYQTVQQAINAAESGQTIFVKSGTYREQVFVPKDKSRITIIGQSSADKDFQENTVTITAGKARDNPSGSSNDATAVLRAHGDLFKLYNVNLVNTRGKGAQALALSASGDKQGYYGCQFRGYQDTVLLENGEQLFVSSLFEGATDFIFGMKGRSRFERVTINVIGPGFITGKLSIMPAGGLQVFNSSRAANGRSSASSSSYFVFNDSEVQGDKSLNGKSFLGRPWREYSRVVFQNSKLGAVVNAAGWAPWSSQSPNTAHVQFGEYGNTGPGATGQRRLSRALSSPVGIDAVLPQHESWTDSRYLHS